MVKARLCDKSLHKAMTEHPNGSFLHIKFVAGPDWHCEAWVALAHLRGSRPKLSLLAKCTLDTGSRMVSMSKSESGFDFIMGVSLAGEMLQTAPREFFDDVHVYCARAPVEEPAIPCASAVKLPADWGERLRDQQVLVHPMAPTAPAADGVAKFMKKGLNSLFAKPPARRRRSAEAGVQFRRPPTRAKAVPAPGQSEQCCSDALRFDRAWTH